MLYEYSEYLFNCSVNNCKRKRSKQHERQINNTSGCGVIKKENAQTKTHNKEVNPSTLSPFVLTQIHRRAHIMLRSLKNISIINSNSTGSYIIIINKTYYYYKNEK